MDYCRELLHTLNEFRLENHLCDVELIVGNDRFAAHKNVLCASSIFFNGLFSSSMRERQENTVNLKQFPVSIMEDLLTYLYTGKLEVTEATAQDFLAAADFLLLPKLKTILESELEQYINPFNCIPLLHAAKAYSCQRLASVCIQCMKVSFSEVSKLEEFSSLNFSQVFELISSRDIIVQSEEEVCEAVICWVESNPNTKDYFTKLFQQIRLFCLQSDYIRGLLSNELLDERCLRAIELSKHHTPTSPYLMRPRTCLDDYIDVVLLCNRAFDPAVVCYAPCLEEWYEFQPIAGGISWQCLAYCNGCVYAVSGNGWSGCINPASHVHCYDPSTNTWAAKAPLLHDADEFGMAAIGKFIYVVGGHNRHGVRTELLQRYDTCTDTWELMSPLHPARSGTCVVSHNNQLYVFGGSTNDKCLTSSMIYDQSSDSWSQVAPMSYSRSSACGIVVSEKVFIISGHSDEAYGTNSINDIKPITACEVYDIRTNSWSSIPDITLQRSNAGVVHIDGKIYVFGGDDMISFAQQGESMEYFDIESCEWSSPVEFSDLHVTISRPRACALRLPKSFVQALNNAI
ncbi:kelch-like protein diablo isoform X1 [Nematostella vectensis]|uniref:kelch-like protein diablo isoform X1 n=2 Tax=Nematostella vectensis TaxID=45351 RepID=UPI00207779EC|nr:kelch-like protein diablo isoform X1 [Nematostella vectensis]